MLTPKETADIALLVAIAGAHGVCRSIQHRFAWNIAERDQARAVYALGELSALGLWSDGPDLPGGVARLTAGRVTPNGLAERTLSMGLLAAEVYILAREADAVGFVLAHEPNHHVAPRLVALAPRLASLRESLGLAIARFTEALDDTVYPAVREAVLVLANAASADVPVWNGPKAMHLGRPGEKWTSSLFEGLRRTCVALGFPPERTPSAETDAEVACVKSILARPDDDALRHEWIALASARGEIRAELARAQMRTRDERRRRPLNSLVFDSELVGSLVGRHPEWQSEIRRLGATAAWLYRGFVEDIEIDAAAFLARGRELFDVAPILHVRLRGGAARLLEPLLAAGMLDRMLAIDLAGQELDDTHAEMLAARRLTNLRALTLDGNHFSEAGARALYASESLRQLVFLSLRGNSCGPLAETGFTHAEYPTQIVELTAFGARLEAELGHRRYSYELNAPSFDVLTVEH